MTTNGNGQETEPTLEEKLEAVTLAQEEAARILVMNAVMAETMLRVLVNLAVRIGVPKEMLRRNLVVVEGQVIADLKAGRFSPLKFDHESPFEERLGPSDPLPQEK